MLDEAVCRSRVDGEYSSLCCFGLYGWCQRPIIAVEEFMMAQKRLLEIVVIFLKYRPKS